MVRRIGKSASSRSTGGSWSTGDERRAAARRPGPPRAGGGGRARRGGSRRSRATGARPRPRGARSSCRRAPGESVRSSFQTASADGLAPVVAEAPRQVEEDRRGRRAPRRAARSALRTRCTRRSRVGDRALGLAPARRPPGGRRRRARRSWSGRCPGRRGGRGREQAPRSPCLVGLGLDRVLADDVERRSARPAPWRRTSRSGASRASAGRRRPRPRRTAARSGVVLDVLEAGQPVGEGAHVAAALDVVLAAQRVQARARSGRRGR